MLDVHTPSEVCMGLPFQPATPAPSAPSPPATVFIPSIVADHALDAALLGAAGAETTPSKVMSSPTRAPVGGDKGSTLIFFVVGVVGVGWGGNRGKGRGGEGRGGVGEGW